MERNRIHRDRDDLPTPSPAGGVSGNRRDYRQESTDVDSALTESVRELARMYNPSDVVNRGAQ